MYELLPASIDANLGLIRYAKLYTVICSSDMTSLLPTQGNAVTITRSVKMLSNVACSVKEMLLNVSHTIP